MLPKILHYIPAMPFAFFPIALLTMATMNAQVIATYDFEDGTTQGWTSFNGASAPANSTAAAQSGTHSLLTTTNSSGSGGPAILLNNLLPGAVYQITGYVMLTSGETATSANFTVKRSDPNCNGGTCYDTVGNYQVAVSAGGWAQIGGSYTVSTTETSLLLYAQLVGPSTAQSFYLDNVIINEISGPPGGPQDNSGITTTFEDGTLDGWSSRSGSSTLTNSTATAHGGTHSLLTTNRTANWDGPQISVSNKMYNGSQYAISFWIKLLPTDASMHTINVSLQVTLAGSTSYPGVTGYPGVSIPADGNWHQISIPKFNMAYSYDPGKAYLYVQTVPSSGNDLVSFYIDDFQLTYLPPPSIQTNIPSIYQTLSYYFPVGAEIDSSDLTGVHAQLLTKHFNGIVSGNDMKWSSVEKTKGSFTYGAADAQVAFAQSNNLLIRGHNLVWATGQQTPSYVFGDGTNSPANQAVVADNIREHIQNEVQHFGNAVYVWDVINEPIDPNQPDCLVHGPFYNVLGKSYIDIALQTARQYAPPGTKLFINDYRTTDANGLACLVTVLQDLQSRGIPIDGVGHEMHTHIDYPPVQNITNAVNAVANLGLDNQVTELDMSVYRASDNTSNYGANGGTVPASVLAQQGYRYMQFFNALRQLKGKLSSVTFWGIADDNTWLSTFPIARLDMPLPFDANLQAKPAYWGIVDPTQLPGWGLNFTISSKSGVQNARVWTITANNPGPGTAYTTQINGFTLTQVAGAACTPVVTPPSSYPVMLGDIAQGGAANASFTIDFTGCTALARFALKMPWSAANGADTGTFTLGNQYR